MEDSDCPYKEKCKLYKNELLDNNSEEIFKTIYCYTDKHKECKRYKIFQIEGECCDFIMPNSSNDIETLLKQQEEEIRFYNLFKYQNN